MSKRQMYFTCVAVAALAFSPMAMASDIAFYVGAPNPDWYGPAAVTTDVATIIAQTGRLFGDVQKFDDAHREGDNINLRAIARDRLLAAGVAEVRDLGLCTICDERWFSHRREGAVAGRQAGVAWLS